MLSTNNVRFPKGPPRIINTFVTNKTIVNFVPEVIYNLALTPPPTHTQCFVCKLTILDAPKVPQDTLKACKGKLHRCIAWKLHYNFALRSVNILYFVTLTDTSSHILVFNIWNDADIHYYGAFIYTPNVHLSIHDIWVSYPLII